LPLSPVTRAILALGVTQIVGFGTLFYAFGGVAVPLAADLGISLPFAFGAFSLALLAGGAVAPFAGRAIDRHGARRVMATGSVGAALALAVLSQAGTASGLVAALILCEAMAALVLYDAAFAALAQAAGAARARRAITLMTLLGGFASTVFWPVTHLLAEGVGWRQTFLIFAGLHIVICLPLHLTLPRLADPADPGPAAIAPPFPPLPVALHASAMLWLAIGFSLFGVVMSAFSAQWVPALRAVGLTEAAAVAAGTLMGPAQVGVRLLDLFFGVRRHPMGMAILSAGFLAVALAILLVMPVGLHGAMAFAVFFGLSSGLTSIVRGTVPLCLFGAAGYAARLGKLAGWRLGTGAVAPFGLSLALAALGADATLALACGLVVVAMLALWRVPR
jgi:MFS family permease